MTSNIASFVRQLNMYNFHKQKNNSRYQEFKHPFFRRGAIQELKDIHRKTTINYKVSKSSTKKKTKTDTDDDDVKTQLTKTQQLLRMIRAQNRKLLRLNSRILRSVRQEKQVQMIRFAKLALLISDKESGCSLDSSVTRDGYIKEMKDLCRGIITSIGFDSCNKSTNYKISPNRGANLIQSQLEELLCMLSKIVPILESTINCYCKANCTTGNLSEVTECNPDPADQFNAATSMDLKGLDEAHDSYQDDFSLSNLTHGEPDYLEGNKALSSNQKESIEIDIGEPFDNDLNLELLRAFEPDLDEEFF